MWMSRANEPCQYWPPVSDPSLDLQGQSWQSLHRPCTLMSTWGPVCELCISKTFPTCLLCVTHSLLGTLRVRKCRPFLLVLCWKWRAAGGCHHPGNAAPPYPPLWPDPGATPSTAPPWWWGLDTHTHTHTHTQNQTKQAYSANVTLQGHFHTADSTDCVWLGLPQ